MAGWMEDDSGSSSSESELPLPQQTPTPIERRARSFKTCTICSTRSFKRESDLKRHIMSAHHRISLVPARCPSSDKLGRQRARKGIMKMPPSRSRKIEDWYESIPLRPRKTTACGGGGGGSIGGIGSHGHRPASPTVSNTSADTDELMERDDEAIRLKQELERTRHERTEFSRRLAELEGKMQRVRSEIVHLQAEPNRGLPHGVQQIRANAARKSRS